MRQDRKVEIGIRERFGLERVVPDLLGIVLEAMAAHHIQKQVPIVRLLGRQARSHRVGFGVEAVEAGTHVEAVVGGIAFRA